MPRSRRFRKSDSKPEWGKNNPQTKTKNHKLMIIIGIIAVAAVVLAAFFVVSQNNSSPIQPQPTASPSPEPTLPPAYGSNDTKVVFMVQGVTGAGLSFSGNITIELRQDRPQTTAAFLKLVRQGFYDSSTFHRVFANFVLQGGRNSTAPQPPTIPDEATLSQNNNSRGTIAMANTGQINSARNEFFINLVNNSNSGTKFDYLYTVFGKVISGMEVVDTIAATPVRANPEMPGNEMSMPLNATVIVKAIVLPN
jgi:cyclophilin family peptidyl-prolyl cis-trans isomerase